MSRTQELILKERTNLKKKIFSKIVLNTLLTTYANDQEFESHHMVKVNSKTVKKVSSKPAKDFRNAFVKVLVEFGADENDAKTFMESYNFGQSSLGTIYDFVVDGMYQYLQTGRPLELFAKEDVICTLSLEDVEAGEKEYETYVDFKDKEKGKKKSTSKWKKHKKIKAKSSCPEWQKDKLKDTMEIVLENMYK